MAKKRLPRHLRFPAKSRPGSGVATKSAAAGGVVRARATKDEYIVSRGWCDYHFKNREAARKFYRALVDGRTLKTARCRRRPSPVETW